MKYIDWLNSANQSINSQLVNCFNKAHLGGWSENHITTQILESIEKLGLEIDWADKPQKVKWEGYKLAGVQETTFGDIALVVRVWLTGDRFIDGVAFYEAKRQYFDKEGKPRGFSSIKKEQLSRISSNTHVSHVLLYDVDIEKQKALATSVPIVFVEQLCLSGLASTSGRLLHSYGDIWVKSIGNNFLGLNLDFRKESVDAVKNSFTSSDAPQVLLDAAVAMTNILEPKLDNSFSMLASYDKWIAPQAEPKPEIEPQREDDGPGFGM